MAAIDLSNFTVEQLQEALKKKSPVTEDLQKKCVFKSTRANQPACSDDAAMSYGPNGYCKKHSRTVQALNAKKAWDESSAQAPEPEPEKVVVPLKLETALEEEVAPKEEKAAPVVIPKPEKVEKVLKKVEEKIIKEGALATPTVIKKKITPNKWGRFEEPDTRIVFDPKTKAAYGVQDHSTGKVVALSKKDIDVCKKYQWKYHIIEVEDEEEEEEEFCDVCDHLAEECICGLEEQEKDEEEEGDEEEEEEGEEEEEEEGEGEGEGEEGDEEEEGENDSDDGEEGESDEEESSQEEPQGIPYSFGRKR